MLVLVGSRNPVKVNAVAKAFSSCLPAQSRGVRVVGVAGVKSDVSDQPMTIEETRVGARNRARACVAACSASSQPEEIVPGDVDFCVGLEGGLEEGDDNLLWCHAVMCVLDVRTGRESTSQCGAFPLPPQLCELVRGGMELGDADDLVFARINSKQEDGTVGILTNGVIDRTEYYHHALVLALVPHVKQSLYPAQSLAGSGRSKSVNVKSWLSTYMQMLQLYPIRTKSVTAGLLTAAGSYLGQRISGVPRVNWRNVLIYGAFGLSVTGPVIHTWINLLHRYGPSHALARMCVDRLVFYPPFQYAFFVFVGLFQGKSLRTVVRDTNQMIAGVIANGLRFWPPAMYLIFKYAPKHVQPLFSQLTALCWATYLGWVQRGRSA